MTRHLMSLAMPSSLVLAVALMGPACTVMGGDEEPTLETAQAPGPPNTAILRWNNIARTTLLPADPASSSRAFAMVHVAMHDAVNGVGQQYETYLLQTVDTGADAPLAASKAAHDVLVALRPAQQANLDAELAKDVNKAMPGVRTRSLALGAEAAQLIVAARANDGTSVVVPYTPGSGPGAYQFTPPFNFVILAQWPDVTPFVIASGDQFRAGPPPALDSQEWADNYNEVQARGKSNSTVRTADESQMAIFWQENSALSASKIATSAATQAGSNIFATARAFALMFVAMTDGAIVVTDTKYEYDFWRPYTAIRAGDTDGREDTVADPTWNHFITAPPFPEYASGHATLGQAMAVTLNEVYGDDISFSLTSSVGGATRYYENFEHAAWEGAESRIVGGIHYAFSRDQGLAHGQQVGDYVVQNAFRPN